MWEYQKKLQFPINIKNPNPKLASFIVSQYGGADGKCLSKKSLPKYAFYRFSIFSAFDNFFENCSCHIVLFYIAYIFIF
ncbi:MAG: manganese catalase family protein [Clostridia bacterium]|nr:manganese catalase family protein [Clostridia bacterium]